MINFSSPLRKNSCDLFSFVLWNTADRFFWVREQDLGNLVLEVVMSSQSDYTCLSYGVNDYSLCEGVVI